MVYPNENEQETHMAPIALNPNSRLTDALERAILENSMNQQTVARPFVAFKRVTRAAARGVGALVTYVGEVQESMNKARAKSAHYSGSQW